MRQNETARLKERKREHRALISTLRRQESFACMLVHVHAREVFSCIFPALPLEITVCSCACMYVILCVFWVCISNKR